MPAKSTALIVTCVATILPSVAVCGIQTNMCCETTARDAMMIGYRAVIVHDASAARFDEDHLAGLTSFWQSFGDVRSTDDVIDNLLKSERAGKAAE